MQSSARFTLGALAGVVAGVALVLAQQQTDPSVSQPTIVPSPPGAQLPNDPFVSVVDPAGTASQQVLTPAEKAALALAMLAISDPDTVNRQAEAEWTAEQREQHTASLAAILDPEAYDRATRGGKTKAQLANEAAARFAILEPDAFNAQVLQRMTPAELAQLEAERASFAGTPTTPSGN